jgi:hypothetical protein
MDKWAGFTARVGDAGGVDSAGGGERSPRVNVGEAHTFDEGHAPVTVGVDGGPATTIRVAATSVDLRTAAAPSPARPRRPIK